MVGPAAVGLKAQSNKGPERNEQRKMMRTLLPIAMALLATPALAQQASGPNSAPMSGELTAACMQAMDESQTVCACIENEAVATLSDDEQTFLLAIMTEDETLIGDLRGSFTDADALIVQNQMIASATQYVG